MTIHDLSPDSLEVYNHLMRSIGDHEVHFICHIANTLGWHDDLRVAQALGPMNGTLVSCDSHGWHVTKILEEDYDDQ